MYQPFGLCELYRLFGIMSSNRLTTLATDSPMTSKQTHVPTLLQLFRRFGYAGVSLTQISQATGLGKASLYHHFPGGKADMALAALTQVNTWLETRILPILTRQEERPMVSDRSRRVSPVEPPVIETFQAMCEETSEFFDGGQNACLWAVLTMESASDRLFQPHIRQAFSQWIGAIAAVLIRAGVEPSLAQQRGEDAMIAIQGALIVGHGLQDFAAFQRVLQELPQKLCEGL
jgi:TetR/AcrR family transcriptional regulator, lmrAB and yxaGH operons repressor